MLGHADEYDARISVFTGAVLADDDVPYRGVQIPQKFWKIAAWTMNGRLAAAGFLLDQSPLLGKEELAQAIRERLLADEPPPLGPFHTFQVPLRRVSALAGIPLTRLEEADRFSAGEERPRTENYAMLLTDVAQIRL